MTSPGVAVVTGAGSGIGRAVTRALLGSGWRVALAGRRVETLQETLSGAADPSGDALVHPTDVTDEASVDRLFGDVAGAFGRVDLLFNNAGVFGVPAPFEEFSAEQWRTVVDTNLTGSFLCARAAFKVMKEQTPQGGRIINNGSISAHVPRPHAVAYTATKHAITGLTKTISLEGRPFRVACGQIDVGNAATELLSGVGPAPLQADGTRRPEPTMDVAHVADAVVYMAALPLEANVQFLTVMATNMPYIGRG